MSIIRFKDYQLTKWIALILVWAMFSLDCAWAQDALAPGTKAGTVKQNEVQVVKVEPEVDKRKISEGVKEVVETGVKAGVLVTVSSALSGCADIITQNPIASMLTAVVGAPLIFFASWRIFFPVNWYIWRLNSWNWDARANAAWKLGDIGDKRAVEPLIRALKDKNSNVRYAVVETLGKIGDARAIEPLVGLLVDEESDHFAAQALKRLGWRPSTVTDEIKYHIASANWNELVSIGEPAVGPLIRLLINTAKAGSRIYAADTLAEIGRPAVESLIEAMKEKNRGVRMLAAEALGKIGDVRALELLITALEDESGDVRIKSAWALGRIKDRRAVGPLIKASGDRGELVRRVALDSLGEIGDQRAIETLVRALDDEDRYVRFSAGAALKKLDWQPKTEMEKIHYYIAIRDWNKLIEIGNPAVEPLLDALEDLSVYTDGITVAIEVLGEIGDARAIKLLADFSQSVKPEIRPTQGVRQSAVKALGTIGDVQAIKPLIRTLGDVDSNVRHEAIEALVRIGNPALKFLRRTLFLTRKKIWVERSAGTIESPDGLYPAVEHVREENPKYLAIKEAIRAIENPQRTEPTVPQTPIDEEPTQVPSDTAPPGQEPSRPEPTPAQRELSELQAGHANEVVAGRQVVAAALEQAIQQTQARITAIEEANRQLANSQTSLQEKNATSTRLQGEIAELEARLAGQNKAYQEAEAAFKNAQATYKGIADTVNELKMGYEIEVQSSRPKAAEAIKKVLDVREGQLRDAERFSVEKERAARETEATMNTITQELQGKRQQLAQSGQEVESLNTQIAQWNQTLLNLEAGGQLAQQALGVML